MVHYRRARIPGGTYFFTVALRDRRADTLVRHVDLLRDACRSMRGEYPWRTEAMVVLPDHLHAIWSLPEADADFSGPLARDQVAVRAGFAVGRTPGPDECKR